MKILLIPDSFKDSIGASEIIEALSRGLRKSLPDVEIHAIIGSDGGEGFLESIISQLDVEQVYHDTLDPIGRPIEAFYLLDRQSRSAYVELAQSSGLERLEDDERNPLYTTTAGTGLQILHAINKGAQTVYVGMGGSATNDGGIGLASVLGFTFLDESDQTLLPTGQNLGKLRKVEGEFAFPYVKVIGISDVTNPLIGPDGAAPTFAKQKGASSEEIDQLDHGLRILGDMVSFQFEKDLKNIPGAGAAGGTGFGLMAFLQAELRSGIDFVLDLAGVDNLLREQQFDLIITGEGRIDKQSFQGKLIDGVIRASKPYKVPVMAICGQLDLYEEEWRDLGLKYATTISGPEVSKEESIFRASEFIEQIVPDLLKQINP